MAPPRLRRLVPWPGGGGAERGLGLPLAEERGQRTPRAPWMPSWDPWLSPRALSCSPLLWGAPSPYRDGWAPPQGRGAARRGRVPGWASPSRPFLSPQCGCTTASPRKGSTTWSLICKCLSWGRSPVRLGWGGSEASTAPASQAPSLPASPAQPPHRPCLESHKVGAAPWVLSSTGQVGGRGRRSQGRGSLPSLVFPWGPLHSRLA